MSVFSRLCCPLRWFFFKSLPSDALSGDMVDVDGQQMQLIEVENLGDGYYRGKGKMFVDLLGGLGFKTTFERIYIDADRIVGRGRINYVSRGVDNMIVKQVTNQKQRQANRELERLQAANREKYKNTEFHEKVFAFPALVVQNVQVQADGTVLITVTDAEGKNATSPQPAMSQALKDHPAKAMIIEDKNGDQWVVQQGKPPEKVTGGGLRPGMNARLSNQDKDLLKKALRQIRQQNNEQTIHAIKAQKQEKESAYDQFIAQRQASLFGSRPSNTPLSSQALNNIILSEPMAVRYPVDAKWDTLSNSYIRLEAKLLYHQALYAVSDDLLDHKEFDLLAADLKIEGLTYAEYATAQRKLAKTDQAMIPVISQAVEKLIKSIIDKIYE